MISCIDALKAIMALIESGDLVRNTDNDSNVMAFLRQGLKITQVLSAAQTIIDADKISGLTQGRPCSLRSVFIGPVGNTDLKWQLSFSVSGQPETKLLFDSFDEAIVYAKQSGLVDYEDKTKVPTP